MWLSMMRAFSFVACGVEDVLELVAFFHVLITKLEILIGKNWCGGVNDLTVLD